MALRGLLGWFLPAGLFRRIGPMVQGALVFGLLGWTVLMPQFLMAARSIWRDGGWARDAVPPFWFVGLHRTAIGDAGPPGDALARTALLALATTAALVMLVYFAWPARRQFAGGSAVHGGTNARSAASRVIGLAARRLLRTRPIERACFEFTLLGLGRGSAHRLYLAAAVGGGVAWSMSGVFWAFARQGAAAVTQPSMATLQIQFVLALLLMTAVRFAVTVPIALEANWLFRITERQGAARYHAGTRWAALAVGLVPIVALVPAHAAMWGWSAAAYHLLVGACYAAFVVELLFNVQVKVPFAAPYVSGSIRLKTRWLLYLFAASLLTSLPAGLEDRALRAGRLAWLLPVALLGLAGVLMRVRERRERQQAGLVFEEPPLDAIQTLSIFDYGGETRVVLDSSPFSLQLRNLVCVPGILSSVSSVHHSTPIKLAPSSTSSRSNPRAPATPSPPEVQHLDVTGLEQHDVVGLDVSVDDAVLVRFLERFGRPLRDRSRGLSQREHLRGVGDDVGQRPAADELEHDVGLTLLLQDLVDLAADVGVIQLGDRHGLAQEPLLRRFVLRVFGLAT